MCNTWLKFGKLWEYAAATGADRIATGHYARIVAGAGESQLHRAVDPTKDQSYFLFGLRRELLERVLFPVGEMTKDRVRALAEKLGLEVHNKPDSQEVCFVPDGDHRRFIARHRGRAREEEGEIVDETGRKVGVHTGVGNFTIGQRRGLRVAVGEPRYVVQLDAAANRVVIGPREMLLQDQLEAERVNWLSDAPTGPVRCSVKIRYLHPAAAASVEPIDQQRVRVRFDVPQSAVTPGQAAVFYHGNRVLGGGWIR
jgi:tRNA-specific 2-thiouridylase